MHFSQCDALSNLHVLAVEQIVVMEPEIARFFSTVSIFNLAPPFEAIQSLNQLRVKFAYKLGVARICGTELRRGEQCVFIRDKPRGRPDARSLQVNRYAPSMNVTKFMMVMVVMFFNFSRCLCSGFWQRWALNLPKAFLCLPWCTILKLGKCWISSQCVVCLQVRRKCYIFGHMSAVQAFYLSVTSV